LDSFIRTDLLKSFGIVFDDVTPVSGGYLNQKWEIDTNEGRLLIKKFSCKRYSAEKLKAVESALQREILVREIGVPCPLIKMHNGKIIQILNDETAYMIMEYRKGVLRDYQNISMIQMYNLGKSCGQMHEAFAQLPTNNLPFDKGNTVEALWENYFIRLKEAQSSGLEEYIQAVNLQSPFWKHYPISSFQTFRKVSLIQTLLLIIYYLTVMTYRQLLILIRIDMGMSGEILDGL